jgi:DNA-binding MarR family transcriptional regulator
MLRPAPRPPSAKGGATGTLAEETAIKRSKPLTGHYNSTAWVESGAGEAPEAADGNAGEDIRRLRPLTVLEHLSEASQPLTLAQLAATMRVPKSTLMRLLRSMEAQGYLLHMPAERGYVPGTRATTLALRMLRGSNIRRECRAVLRNLVRSLGETCNLTVPDAGRVLYVERIDTTAPLRMHLPPGTWVPMHCTASGKLFLASMPLLERRSILAHSNVILVLLQKPHRLRQRIPRRNGSPSSRVHMISMMQVLPWFICRSMAFFSAGPTSSSLSTVMPSAPMARAMPAKDWLSSSPATKRRL